LKSLCYDARSEKHQIKTKMVTDVLIKAGRPDSSCTSACYVGR